MVVQHQRASADCRITRIFQANRVCRALNRQRVAARGAEHSAKLDELAWKVLTVRECQVQDGACLGERKQKFPDGT